MKTSIEFIDSLTGKPSDCGEQFEIELSSADLKWQGIKVEKGRSPYFYPKNIVTPYFYFAMLIDSHFNWIAINDGENNVIDAIEGDIWINPPNTPFTHIVSDSCSFILFTIEEKTLFMHYNDTIPNHRFKFLNSYNIRDDNLKYFIYLFYNEMILKGSNGYNYIDGLIKAFSNYFIKNYSNYSAALTGREESRISFEKMNIIDKYIQDNIFNEISIDSLAKLIGISKYYFLKEFRKYKGITPYQYILHKKLETSKNLLGKSGKPIIEIAYDLGFSDQSHLNKLFKKYYGLSPKKFRNNNIPNN